MGISRNSNAGAGVDAMNRSGRVPATRRVGLAYAATHQYH